MDHIVRHPRLRKKRDGRHGMTTLDYVMVTAVVVPVTFTLFLLMLRVYTALYNFCSVSVGWPVL